MTKKSKFALKMADDVEVRNDLDELRAHFDIEKAVEYFLSGELLEWLKDRYYEEEAEAVAAIDRNAPDLRERLCKALGVCYESEPEMLDTETLARLNEKKAILRQRTDDEDIIARAVQTALTQEDLADLLDQDAPVIYLCGDKFRIPMREKGKRYIGILGTPVVEIRASSQNELDEREIFFENVRLPWGEIGASKHCGCCGELCESSAQFCPTCGMPLGATTGQKSPSVGKQASANKEWHVPKELLKTMFATTFKKDFEAYGEDNYATFLMVEDWSTFSTSELVNLEVALEHGDLQKGTAILNDDQISASLSLICSGNYTKDELIHLRIADDMSRGWAFTRDSFCVLEKGYSFIVPYTSLELTGNKGIKLPDRSEPIEFSDMLGCFPGSISTLLGGFYLKESPTGDALETYLANMKMLFLDVKAEVAYTGKVTKVAPIANKEKMTPLKNEWNLSGMAQNMEKVAQLQERNVSKTLEDMEKANQLNLRKMSEMVNNIVKQQESETQRISDAVNEQEKQQEEEMQRIIDAVNEQEKQQEEEMQRIIDAVNEQEKDMQSVFRLLKS